MAKQDVPIDPALLLSVDQRQALANRHVLGSSGSLAVRLALNSDLSDGIPVERNTISLVMDPKDASEDFAVVYLINASDHNLVGAVREQARATREIFNGWYWENCDPLRFYCPTFPDELDLAPGHVLVLTGDGFMTGDEVGQIRYSIALPSGEVLATKPLRGRYSTACLKASRLRGGNGSYVPFDIRSGLLNGNWAECRVVSHVGEVQAALEIERHFDTSFSARGEVLEWLDSVKGNRSPGPTANPEMVAGVSRVLGADWDHHLDYQSRLVRCLAALTFRPDEGQTVGSGSPEGCRAMVLRYLFHCRLQSPSNPEEKEHHDRFAKFGNPWAAGPEELKIIRREAEYSVRSGNEAEKAAASKLLALPCLAEP